VVPNRENVYANDAAVDLLGESWRERAAVLVEHVASRGRTEEWHHGVVSVEVAGERQQYAVHTTLDQNGFQLLLLEKAKSAMPGLSSGLEDMLESISDCLFAVDEEGTIVYVNSQAANFFGSPRETLVGKNLAELHPGDGRFDEAYRTAIEQRQSVTYDARLAENDTWIEVRAYPVEFGMAVYFSDISDRISNQEHLTFLALHDTLTQLPNRRYLQEQMVRAVARARRGHRSAVLFMDMDRFKVVNDTVGHAAGDAVLIEFARVVGTCIREEDMLARFGGDEFALLIEAATIDDAERVASRIHSVVRGHEFRIGAHAFSLGVSIGMTLIDGTLEEDHVMVLADDAMYDAKNQGGERTCTRTVPGAPPASHSAS
jgi:diguanylate cyclase (GGDEF)-like protein/PAS domain S-box-containing protein